MVKVTNNNQSDEVVAIVPKKKGTGPDWATLKPGQSDDLDLYDRQSTHNTAREAMGTITIHDKVGKEAHAAAVAATADAKPKT